jgi:hypothetical protein
MVGCMRARVDLPDELLTLARTRAAEEGRTPTALLADGLPALGTGGGRAGARADGAARGAPRAARPGQRDAVSGVVIEVNHDTPLSPAPFQAGATGAALRLVVDDPVRCPQRSFSRTGRGGFRACDHSACEARQGVLHRVRGVSI